MNPRTSAVHRNPAGRIARRRFLGTTFAGLASVSLVTRAAARRDSARVLLLTGVDYPGHLWKETAPALAAQLGSDRRLQVEVVETPEFLADPKLRGFEAVVFHWMNWEKPSPGEAARENFRKFIASGKGLVLVHFACGAFPDWPEFGKIAGRVYDPKLPPHDPRGPYLVRIADAGHPITEGMQDFEADDELYTCLAGDTKVRVLATSRSKVTGKDEPMAFVLGYGRGRVFHSPLGHDVKALTLPGVAELFRRGTAWAAGLPPVARQA